MLPILDQIQSQNRIFTQKLPDQGPDLAFGLSLVLFTFMLVPTLVVLLAVVVFFLFFYPQLRKFVCQELRVGKLNKYQVRV